MSDYRDWCCGVENGVITDRFSTFCESKVPIPYRIEQLTSINDSMVMDAPDIQTYFRSSLNFARGAVMVAHNADFDMSFIIENCKRQGRRRVYICGYGWYGHFLLPALNRFKLDTVAKAVRCLWTIITEQWTIHACTAGFLYGLWKC